MTTVIPNPPVNPVPYTPEFEAQMTAWLAWLTENSHKFGDVAEELNAALNASLLGTTSSSVTSLTITAVGTSKTLTVQANKGYVSGMLVKLASTANVANYMKVRVASYNIDTGELIGTVESFGGSGTFASWSVFFDVQDPTIQSVPTGVSVPAGALLAKDDAGNSMAVDSVAPATILASNVTMMTTFPMSGEKTGILFTVGTTDLRFMSVNKDRSISQSSVSVGTIAGASNAARGCELTNGNIAICYSDTVTQYPAVKIISPAGLDVVAKTNPESVALAALPQVAALTGGGFAMTWSTGSFTRYIVYTNTLGITKALSNVFGGTNSQVGVVASPGGGFMTCHSPNSPYVQWFDAAGNLTNSISVNLSQLADQIGFVDLGSFAIGFYVTTSLGLVIKLVSKTAQQDLVSGAQLKTPDPYVFAATYTVRAVKLGNGNTLAILSLAGTRAVYVIVTPEGNFVRGGTLMSDAYSNGNEGLGVTPLGNNGFAILFRAQTTNNIKMFVVNSGELLGVSLGASGSRTNYLPNGSVNATSENILNVGSESVNYTRQGAKVVM